MIYLRDSKVKELAKKSGKRVSKDYLIWLDEQVRRMVNRHCEMMHGTKTLNSKDASALEVLNK